MAKKPTTAAAALAEARRIEAEAAAAAAEAEAAAAEAEAADETADEADDELVQLAPVAPPATHPVPPSMQNEIGVFDAPDVAGVTPESNDAPAQPETVVVVVQPEAAYTPKLSERTLAEMAAGQAALARRGG